MNVGSGCLFIVALFALAFGAVKCANFMTMTPEQREVRRLEGEIRRLERGGTGRRPVARQSADGAMEALAACQRAIRDAAAYKVIKGPGHAANHGRGDEFYFAWPRGKIVLQNAFGADVASSAACIGSISRCVITDLTINGEDALAGPVVYACGR